MRRGLFTLKVSSLSRSLTFKVFSRGSAHFLYCTELYTTPLYLLLWSTGQVCTHIIWRFEMFWWWFLCSWCLHFVCKWWSDTHQEVVQDQDVGVAVVNAKRVLFVTQTAWKMTSSYPPCVTDLRAWTSCRSRQSSPKRSCRCSTGASKT